MGTCMKQPVSIRPNIARQQLTVKKKPIIFNITKAYNAVYYQHNLLINNSQIQLNPNTDLQSRDNSQIVKVIKTNKINNNKQCRLSRQFNIVMNNNPQGTVSCLTDLQKQNNIETMPNIDSLQDLNLQNCMETVKNINPENDVPTKNNKNKRKTQSSISTFQIPYTFSFMAANPLQLNQKPDKVGSNQQTASQVLPKIKEIQHLKFPQNKRYTAPISLSCKTDEKIQTFVQSKCQVVIPQ